MSRAAICLFILLNAVLLNGANMPNGNTLTRLNINNLARQLAQAKTITPEKNAPNKVKNNKDIIGYKRSTNPLCENGKDDEDSIILEEKRLLSYFRKVRNLLFIGERDMNTILKGYYNLQNIEYNRMMERLLHKLNSFTAKVGMSEEEKMKLWNECTEEIIERFKELDKAYKKIYKISIEDHLQATPIFNGWVSQYVKLWRNAIITTEKHWSDSFTYVAGFEELAAPKTEKKLLKKKNNSRSDKCAER
ncbi:unnamed protein product [Plasmodium vivax]|uniref:(malaria parasite P. vivax) hypothetical protein n=1 Tax=Plasmodium vivax TaxID=5855 RepID=A0A8S4HFM1_PLAVI|nr:unnamed protein product [Plasmodium vivax]